MGSSPSKGSREPILSVITSPYIKSITLIKGDKAFLLQYHAETRSLYAALVANGYEEPVRDGEVLRAARILTRLMRIIAKSTKSRYYSFTGMLKLDSSKITFRPYISPTSTAAVAIDGNVVLAEVPGLLRKKIKTSVDVESALRHILKRMEKLPGGDDARLDDL